MVNYWSRNADNLLVGRLYGTSDLGIYNRAYNLLTFPLSLITGLIRTELFPNLNKIKESEQAVKKRVFIYSETYRFHFFSDIICVVII